MKKLSNEDSIEKIKQELIDTMKAAGIDTTPYSIAIRITAETLNERERAYKAYLEAGAKQINEKGGSNPYALRLTSWNTQARACLSMLKLTPCRYKPAEEDSSEVS